MPVWDCIVIGAGHNGLVCAAYLARAGRRVLVLERAAQVGGAAVTDEILPGFRVSTASYLISLLSPQVERDLRLADFGYRMLPRTPSSFTPLADGRGLMLGADAEFNREQIARFSARDADAFPRYEAWLTRIAEVLEPMLEDVPPALLPLPAAWRRSGLRTQWRELQRLRRTHRAFRRLGDDLPAAMELLLGPARPVLERWFESEPLRATLATDAVIGAMAAPSAPGTGYVLLHHVIGMAGGARGVWGYVQGGMGALTQAIAGAARARGAEIRCNAEVAGILVEGGRAAGVRVAGGEVLRAHSVASGATADVTFRRLLPDAALPPAFREAVARIDYSSAAAKINLAVSELPDFTAAPGRDAPGPQHRGTVHFAPSLDYIEQAFDQAKYGQCSQRPVIEMTIPSAVDDSLAPPGQHVMQLFVQYAPYRLAGGDWDGAARDRLADACLAEIARYAPNVPGSVLARQVLAPPDLEARFGLTGGNIFHGAMTPHQLFSLRPVPGWCDYRTPVPGLFLCGSAAHPGGGVSGIPGRNGALAVLGKI